MLDAAEKLVRQLARPGGNEPRRPVSVVEVLVRGHRRNANDITGLPGILGLLMDIVAFAFLN